MVGELARTGWHYEGVYPVGDAWIAGVWAAAVIRLLAAAAP